MLHCPISYFKDPITNRVHCLTKIVSKDTGNNVGWIYAIDVKYIGHKHSFEVLLTNVHLVHSTKFPTKSTKEIDVKLKLIG